jgi:hypothetical protein
MGSAGSAISVSLFMFVFVLWPSNVEQLLGWQRRSGDPGINKVSPLLAFAACSMDSQPSLCVEIVPFYDQYSGGGRTMIQVR